MEVLNFVLGQTEGRVRADLLTLQGDNTQYITEIFFNAGQTKGRPRADLTMKKCNKIYTINVYGECEIYLSGICFSFFFAIFL